MGCAASSPVYDTPMPESIAYFFNGEPMAGKAEKYMGTMVADSHMLKFVGPNAYPFLPPDGLDKEAFGGAAKNLIGSFPDLTFNFNKATPKRNKDGSWSADIIVMGTHTGAAFTPMPGKLPPVEATGKCVKIGPETFTLWADADGKVVKTEITPGATKGVPHPHGPPGFYAEIGGVLPGAPAPLPDALMMAEVKDFEDWHTGFAAHATETTFPMNGTTYTVPLARKDACDEAKTLVFHEASAPTKVAITMFGLDFAKFGPVMADPQFVEMSAKAIVSQDPPLIMADPGPPPEGAPPGPPSMFFYVEVADVDKWIEGFKAHGTSKTGTWGYEVPVARGDFCDEGKTKVYKCATNPKLVGAYMEGVRMDVLGPVLGDPEFQKLTTTLGEVEGTKVMKVVAPMPAP